MASVIFTISGGTIEVPMSILPESTVLANLTNGSRIEMSYPNPEEVRIFFQNLSYINRGDSLSSKMKLGGLLMLLKIAHLFGFTETINRLMSEILDYLNNNNNRIILSNDIERNILLLESLQPELQASLLQHLKINLKWIYKVYNLEKDTTVNNDIKLLSGNLDMSTLAYGTKCRVVKYVDNDIIVKKWIFKSNPIFTIISEDDIAIVYPDSIDYESLDHNPNGYFIRILGKSGEQYVPFARTAKFIKGGLGIVFEDEYSTKVTDLNGQIYFQDDEKGYSVASNFQFMVRNIDNIISIIPWIDNEGFVLDNDIEIDLISALPNNLDLYQLESIDNNRYRTKVHITPESNLIGIEIIIRGKIDNLLLLFQTDGTLYTSLIVGDKSVIGIGVKGVFLLDSTVISNKIISYVSYGTLNTDIIYQGNISNNLIYTGTDDKIAFIDSKIYKYVKLTTEGSNSLREYMNILLQERL